MSALGSSSMSCPADQTLPAVALRSTTARARLALKSSSAARVSAIRPALKALRLVSRSKLTVPMLSASDVLISGMPVSSNKRDLARGLGQLAAEIWMGDADQRLGALLGRLAAQVDGAMLGDDPFDVHAHVRHHRHFRHDAGDRALLGRRLDGNDRLAAAGERGAFDEVELPTRAAVFVIADELGIDLAVKIDLDRGVDRDEVVVLGDDADVVD